MADIFLSYAREDVVWASRLAEALAERGWSVFWDRRIPIGKSFDQVIEQELDAARCVIVLWSRSSVSSDWVKGEASEGARRGILHPVWVEEVRIPLEFRRLQTAQLADWQPGTHHAQFDQLLRDIEGMLGQAAVATRLTTEPETSLSDPGRATEIESSTVEPVPEPTQAVVLGPLEIKPVSQGPPELTSLSEIEPASGPQGLVPASVSAPSPGGSQPSTKSRLITSKPRRVVLGSIAAAIVLLLIAIGLVISNRPQTTPSLTPHRDPAPSVAATTAKDDAQTLYEKGEQYYNGRGVEKDYAKAAEAYRQAASAGHARAQKMLGSMYAAGEGVAKDEAKAATWYRKAADQGHAGAQAVLGLDYATGRGVPKDEAEAVRWYRKAADQGLAEAQTVLGIMYANGRGVPKDEVEAVSWYRKAADQGNEVAQNQLGLAYAYGRGVSRNDAEAVAWYRKAATQGDAVAQHNLGGMYETGRGVPRNEAEAVKWYRKASDQGLTAGQTALGLMYANGRGVPKDEAEAVRWYRKAADQGEALAQTALGTMYRDGRGVPKDEVEAVRWYRKAADQGEETGQNALGRMYADGRGVPKDDVQAVTWYRKAADQGSKAAQRNLGGMYADGRGVPKDDAEAITWYRKAVLQGDKEAQRIMQKRGLTW